MKRGSNHFIRVQQNKNFQKLIYSLCFRDPKKPKQEPSNKKRVESATDFLFPFLRQNN